MKNVRGGKSGKRGYSGPREEHEQDLNPAHTQALTDISSACCDFKFPFYSTLRDDN